MEYNTGIVTARLQLSKSINVILKIFDFCQDLTYANDSYTRTHSYMTCPWLSVNLQIFLISKLTIIK